MEPDSENFERVVRPAPAHDTSQLQPPVRSGATLVCYRLWARRSSTCCGALRRSSKLAGISTANERSGRMAIVAIQNWEPSDLPGWLTRDVYLKHVRPALARVAKSQICSALWVSAPYSSDFRAGKRHPHPRHWQALAELVDLTES